MVKHVLQVKSEESILNRLYNYILSIEQFLRILPITLFSQFRSQFIVNIGFFAAFLYLKYNILLKVKKYRKRISRDYVITGIKWPRR